MAHLLEQQISAIRGRARRILRWYAFAGTIAVAAGTILVVSTCDFALRLQDPGLRWMATLLVVAVSVGAAVWLLRAARRVPLGDLALAQTIERRNAPLVNQISSALEFLRQPEDDPGAGSPALRRAVIHQATAAADQIDFLAVVNPAPAWRAILAASATGALIAAIALLHPTLATTAAARLLMPWSRHDWPKVHSLEVRHAPERLALGEAFEIEAFDSSGRLPDEVRIHYRISDDLPTEVEVMKRMNDVAVARRDAATRSFWYWVEGGDDQTVPWQWVEVVAPPHIEELNVVVHPPEYTGLPVEDVDPDFRALQGSIVEMSGRANKRLVSGDVIIIAGDNSAVGDRTFPLTIADDGRGFYLPADGDTRLDVRETCRYRLRLVDESRIASSVRDGYEIRAITDAAPTVSIESPSDDLYVIPTASIPIVFDARDDLALRSAKLSFQSAAADHSESTASDGVVDIDIWSSPPSPSAMASGQELAHLQSTFQWDLASLNLAAPTTLAYQVVVSDYLPQSGESIRRRLNLVSMAELEERLSRQLGQLLVELHRSEKIQQDTEQQISELALVLREAGRWRGSELDQAQAAALAQRQITKLLTAPQESIQRLCADVAVTLTINRLDQPEIQHEVEAARELLSSLGQEHLEPIDQRLTAAIKTGQSLDAGQENVAGQVNSMGESLDIAVEHQQAVKRGLEALIDSLAQWDDHRRFAREIAALRREQATLREQASRLSEQTLGLETHEIDLTTQSEMKKLAGKQLALARRLEQTNQQMIAATSALSIQNPRAASSLADAVERIESSHIGATMRFAADQVAANRQTLAVERQDQAIAELDEVLAILTQRREHELTRLIKKLRQTEQELQQLQAEQEKLQRTAATAAKSLDDASARKSLEKLSTDQAAAQDRTARIARELERLQATAAQRAAESAVKYERESGEAGKASDATGAAKSAKRAAKALDDAGKETAAQRQQVEAELAGEQVAKLETSVVGLRARQSRLNVDTRAFAIARRENQELNRDEQLQCADFAADQRLLQNEAAQLSRGLQASSVFRLTLDSAAREMGVAVAGLEQRKSDESVLGAQRASLRLLEQMVAAFKRDPQPSQPPKPPGATSEAKPSSPRQAKQAQRILAEVKMLRALQADLSSRYRELVDSDQPSSEKQEQLFDLAKEQGRLGELTLQWVDRWQPGSDDAEFPDLRLDGPADEERNDMSGESNGNR